ncbi:MULTISPECIES: PhaM family polyhydroxyalkanoate granule multifunctional regulatory protein [unclassified Variovorax]|uniref:PhaM family polyhydroxyalkanoate granule multifunctional regulatory protein n=1 Tax=unclassified Variovorax TaxID=663243 RepID=UPI001BD46F4B|nr:MULTISPECIES: PhaM family polyhydroxyalkanoate granule multifunctional regulatory protein [unclassified Variovorax]
MSDAGKPFNFGSFVPGFDFLKNLAAGSASSASSAVPGLQGLASWVAPTLSVEEVDKRIRELKTVQFWLEQNLTALKATIQALEVQKMTLSTLRGMNVRMEDLASSFTRAATMTPSMTPVPAPPPPAAPKAAPEPEPEEEEEEEVEEDVEEEAADAVPAKKAKAKPSPAGVVDPLQWWGALTQQFEQIASSALREASSMKMPGSLQSTVDLATGAAKKAASGVGKTVASKKAATRTKAAGAKAPASTKRASASAKRAAPKRR